MSSLFVSVCPICHHFSCLCVPNVITFCVCVSQQLSLFASVCPKCLSLFMSVCPTCHRFLCLCVPKCHWFTCLCVPYIIIEWLDNFVAITTLAIRKAESSRKSAEGQHFSKLYYKFYTSCYLHYPKENSIKVIIFYFGQVFLQSSWISPIIFVFSFLSCSYPVPSLFCTQTHECSRVAQYA